MTNAFRVASSAVLCTAAICAIGIAPASAQVIDVLKYEVPAQVTLNEPVIAKVTVNNDTRDPILIQFGWDYVQYVVFTVVDPQGVEKTIVPKGPAGISVGSSPLVKPHEADVHSLLLSQWIDFAHVGTYQVTITFTGVIRTAGAAAVTAHRSTTMPVIVLPRDEVALKKACDGLLHTVTGSNVFAVWQEALFALATVHDPAAVPFLAKAVDNKPAGARLAIQAIEQIGGADATSALTVLSKNTNVATAALAAASLHRLTGRS